VLLVSQLENKLENGSAYPCPLASQLGVKRYTVIQNENQSVKSLLTTDFSPSSQLSDVIDFLLLSRYNFEH
jgi:hypothetical protein